MDRTRTAVLALTMADGRDIAAVGREARLELAFERRGTRTILTHSYAEPPLRTGHALDDGRGAHLIVASSAPGIFGGDTFVQHVTVGEGARVRLTSQSSLQIHPSSTAGTARIRSTFTVKSGGELICAWHPTIPFAGSQLDQQIEILLAEDARLSWSDALMAGRAARGERWAFARLSHQLAVRRSGRLEYLERWRVAPCEDTAITHEWVSADCTHLGTVLTSGPRVEAGEAEALHARLNGIADVQAAADLLDERLLLVRVMSRSAVAFHEARAVAESEHATHVEAE